VTRINRNPPFDYEVTPQPNVQGDPYIDEQSAAKNVGDMRLNIAGSYDNASAADVVCRLGIYFDIRKMGLSNATLSPTSSISSTYHYWVGGIFQSAQNNVYVSLSVAKYNSSNIMEELVASRIGWLYNRDSWYFYGWDTDDVRDRNIELSLQCSVDNTHYYVVWVELGAHIAVGRRTLPSFSMSSTQANARVSNINVEFHE